MRILGIDPGSRATGFGIIERRGSELTALEFGILRPPKEATLAERLAFIHEGLARVAAETKPDTAAVERGDVQW